MLSPHESLDPTPRGRAATYDDHTLVRGALAGDVARQRLLFQRHRSTLQHALTRCGFHAADVAELEQRVWLRLLGPRQALASFRGQGSFAGWLRRIAINEARSELRRRHRAGTLDGLETIERMHDPHTPERTVLEDETRTLLSNALRDAVGSLSETDRSLLMAWADGTTTDALARTRGVHRSSMSRRLDKLRRTVGARTRAHLWTHYGRASSELTLEL